MGRCLVCPDCLSTFFTHCGLRQTRKRYVSILLRTLESFAIYTSTFSQILFVKRFQFYFDWQFYYPADVILPFNWMALLFLGYLLLLNLLILVPIAILTLWWVNGDRMVILQQTSDNLVFCSPGVVFFLSREINPKMYGWTMFLFYFWNPTEKVFVTKRKYQTL